jgi:hypothetical protein
MTAPLAAVWLLLAYPWGLWAFVALACCGGWRRGALTRHVGCEI